MESPKITDQNASLLPPHAENHPTKVEWENDERVEIRQVSKHDQRELYKVQFTLDGLAAIFMSPLEVEILGKMWPKSVGN